MSIHQPIISTRLLQLLGLLLVLSFTTGALAQESDSLETVGEGFVGGNSDQIDYDNLIKELYGNDKAEAAVDSAALEALAQETVKKQRERRVFGPAPGMMPNSTFNGAYFEMTGASPFLVSDQLYSWYSFIDASVSVKLPYAVYVESLPLYLVVEVSTFSFVNTYPAGGEFKGMSYVGQASVIGNNSAAALGFGFWDGNLGSLLELNYRFRPTINSYLKFATRGVMITNVEPIGATWWVELRISTGLEL